MIIMKTGFFTKLSLLTLLSLFAINSKAELKQTEKEAFVACVCLGVAIGTYILSKQIKSNLDNAVKEALGCAIKEKPKYTDALLLARKWDLERQKRRFNEEKCVLAAEVKNGTATFWERLTYLKFRLGGFIAG